jgi:hypothetical protein
LTERAQSLQQLQQLQHVAQRPQRRPTRRSALSTKRARRGATLAQDDSQGAAQTALQEVLMSAKIIVLGSIVLFGCRGAALHAQESEPRERSMAGAPVAAPAPMQLGEAGLSLGACPAKSLGSGSARGVSRRSMERIPVSFRSSGIVFSAWRVQADSDQGPGHIVLVDRLDGSGSYYLGEGIFAGCSQSHLSSAYRGLAQTSFVSEPEPLQLD